MVLVAVKSDGNKVTLSFQTGLVTVDIIADYAVLALPFTTLREVDLSGARFSDDKLRVIREYGMGTNAKIHVEVKKKTWPFEPTSIGGPFDGITLSEWDSLGTAWDDTVFLGPNGEPALLCAYPGGHLGKNGLTGAAHGKAPPADVNAFLEAIDKVFPGTKKRIHRSRL